jgi:leucyl aminopeptidase
MGLMEIKLVAGTLHEIDAPALIVLSFESAGAADDELNRWTGGWLAEVTDTGEFSGKSGELAVLHRPSGMKARQLALVGGGQADKFQTRELRKALGAAVRTLKGRSLSNLCVGLRERTTPETVQAAVEAAILADFEPDSLKTEQDSRGKRLRSFAVCVAESTPELESAVERGRILAESQNFARELVNEPANRLTPLMLAERARQMAAETGLECEVLDEPRMRQIGMGALLGVAQGSDNPPALIVLRYQPDAALSAGDHLGLVGKGVTFDTGGVSIKPSEGMEKMKYDMGGGAAVLAAMRSIALLRPSVPVTAFIPTVENMVSGRAQRPGDVVTSLNGKTVEVLNTDAEGRLILIDALTYAIRNTGVTHLLDAATLTGAIVVALGHLHVGAFTNDEALLERLQDAARLAGENVWHMPLDDEYKEYLKSAFADLGNIGGRWGGAVTAAKFLEAFVEDKPWVHLDIAGTAWLDEAKPHMAKGPTGVLSRTFAQVALSWSGNHM